MTTARDRDQIRAEATRRRAVARAQGSAAITRMLGRGETLETIAKFTGVGIGTLRLMVVHTVHQEAGRIEHGSDALGVAAEGGTSR